MAETPYNKKVERVQSGTDPRELPEKVSREVIADVEQVSAALQLCKTQRMTTRQERLTLEGSFPSAYWLNGDVDYPTLSGQNASGSQRAKDSQPKQTTTMTWDSKTLAAEELAVLVVIPDNYIDDSGVPLFSEIRPKIATAFAKAIDDAVLWGVNSPFAQNGVIEGAISNGNIVTWSGTNTAGTNDIVGRFVEMGYQAAQDGITINKFVTGVGFDWRLHGLRDTTGQLVYTPATDSSPGRLFGRPHIEVTNGTWHDSYAIAAAGDFQYAIVGIRQDITFSLSDSGVIYDPATQKVVYSAFQQDGKILRAVMRLAFIVVQPLRHLTGQKNYPFWALQQQAAS